MKKRLGIVIQKTFKGYKGLVGEYVQQFWVYDDSFFAGMNAIEKRAFVKEAMQEGWATSSRSMSSQLIQQSIKKQFGSKVPLWNVTDTYSLEKVMSEIPKSVLREVDIVVKETYESTQKWLKKMMKKGRFERFEVERGVEYYPTVKKGRIELLRGVEKKEVIHSPLSSWTIDEQTAEMFDGHEVLKEFVDPKDIYTCVGSPGWSGTTQEMEFIRIAR